MPAVVQDGLVAEGRFDDGSGQTLTDFSGHGQHAITRLAGAILLEQNDHWAVQRARYMTLETIAPMRDDLTLMLPATAA